MLHYFSVSKPENATNLKPLVWPLVWSTDDCSCLFQPQLWPSGVGTNCGQPAPAPSTVDPPASVVTIRRPHQLQPPVPDGQSWHRPTAVGRRLVAIVDSCQRQLQSASACSCN